MRMLCALIVSTVIARVIVAGASAAVALPAPVTTALAKLDVAWDAPGGEMASMPIGNGDITSNVWVEANGDLAFYLGKSDAWDEISCLLKVGRVRVAFSPALPVENFVQRLDLRRGEVLVTSGTGADQVKVRVWVDANNPVLHVEQTGGVPRGCKATVELWRTVDKPLENGVHTYSEDNITASGATFNRLADTVIPPGPANDQIRWCHRNTASIYPVLLKAQHLESLAAGHPDPLLLSTFGAVGFGTGMKVTGPLVMESAAPASSRMLSFVVLTEQTATLDEWVAKATELAARIQSLADEPAITAHHAWWEAFWDRSHLFVSGNRDADTVTRGYNLQRYMIAASSRGRMPPKFNGGAFTVNLGGKCPFAADNPDYRSWGGSCYWFQNNRWLSWPSLAAGDYDLMRPLFNMYKRALPLRQAVTRTYYQHEGAFFPETMYHWGGFDGPGFGWKNPGITAENVYIRWYWQGGIELTAMMLDYYAHTRDEVFAKDTLLPVADAVMTFYDQHWKRDDKGKIRFDPSAALETYDAVNDAPTIAGLRYTLTRMLALPADLTTPARRAAWHKTLADLPPLPTVAEGSAARLTPADKFWGTRNMENPELYAVFPYRLHGIGMPDMQIAKTTYGARVNRHQHCWSQDCVQSAILGLTGDARARVVGKFSAPSAPHKFPAFWNPNWNFDWTPDMDHGGTAMMALGEMLLQCPGDKIILLPAWPRDWTADFKLHAPGQTILEGHVENGRITGLSVTPESRRKDVQIIEAPPAALSEGKRCAASSQWDGNYAGSMAFDGDETSRWATAANQKTGWLEVDLGQPTAVSRVVINEGFGRVRKFAVNYQSGGEWKTIADGTTIGPDREIKFPSPITARIFRLEILDSSENAPSIYEFQLF